MRALDAVSSEDKSAAMLVYCVERPPGNFFFRDYSNTVDLHPVKKKVVKLENWDWLNE